MVLKMSSWSSCCHQGTPEDEITIIKFRPLYSLFLQLVVSIDDFSISIQLNLEKLIENYSNYYYDDIDIETFVVWKLRPNKLSHKNGRHIEGYMMFYTNIDNYYLFF